MEWKPWEIDLRKKNISLKNIGIGQNENVKCWPCRKGQADKEEFCQSGII